MCKVVGLTNTGDEVTNTETLTITVHREFTGSVMERVGGGEKRGKGGRRGE